MCDNVLKCINLGGKGLLMSGPVEFGLSVSLLKRPAPAWVQAKRMISAYRGWNEFEQRHGGPEIIDFDLSSVPTLASFTSRTQILSELQELRNELDESPAEAEFLRARLTGSIYYLRTLMGQQIPFPEYLEHTLGVGPKAFSRDEITAARDEVDRRLAPFDLEMKSEFRKRFESSFILHDPREIRNGIVGDQKVWLARLRDAGIPVPEKLHFAVEFVEVDAYWSNWISGSLHGITLSINLHPRKKYERGRPLALCLHEICGHAVHMSIWRELIEQGKLDPVYGVTTVHSPEMFVSEGLGQTVADLLDGEEAFPLPFYASRALQYYTLIILHNAHLMAYEGVPIEAALDYARDHLPFSDSDTIESEMRDRGTNALFRTYQLSYTSAERAIRQLIKDFTKRQKQRFFLQMYTTPMTPMQLLRFGAQLE